MAFVGSFVSGGAVVRDSRCVCLRSAVGRWGGRVGVATAPRGSRAVVRMSGEPKEEGKKELRLANTNKDVLILSTVLIAGPLIFNEVLKRLGVEDATAGLWTTALLMVGLILVWTGSYVFRVAKKDMTYAQQLRDYENSVLAQRYKELTDEELSALAEEMESEQGKKK